MLEAVEGRLRLLDVPEVIRLVLLCMLEAVESQLCLLEVLEVLETMRCMLLCRFAGGWGGYARFVEVLEEQELLEVPEMIRCVLLLEAVEDKLCLLEALGV